MECVRRIPVRTEKRPTGDSDKSLDRSFPFCGAEGIRTPDPLDANEVRYRTAPQPLVVELEDSAELVVDCAAV